MGFKLKFWGVRGSIATPSPRHVAFGGNTSCIEVSMGASRVILDCGTGVRTLGHWLARKHVHRATILLSHTHIDHINGLPFFSPAFKKDCAFTVMAGHLGDRNGVRDVLSAQMAQPIFPVPLDFMAAKIDYIDFRAGESFDLESKIKVRTVLLNHPGGATGYRLDYAGRSLCYVTDTEHVIGKPNANILGLIEGADLVIYDSTYTDEEFPSRIGWGHSTWQEGVRLCRAAKVKSLAIFHHDPDHEDEFMARVEAQARATWLGALVARENMRMVLA
jgi:phosphoribosyl 1,2-cyclic phosphodiesterase